MVETELVLCAILARGGSKGIPGKNLREVAGISLVGRAVKFGKLLGGRFAVAISSDDPDILEEASRFGVDFAHHRSSDLARDAARSVDAWRDLWLAYERQNSTVVDCSLLLEPTSPMRTLADVHQVLEALDGDGALSAATVSGIPAHFSPPKAFRISGGGILVNSHA
ncbi:hypothetical protein N9159_00645, partial [bacterium]|nr:hypothetical protein [bacterium]